jgi:hypothetical protein
MHYLEDTYQHHVLKLLKLSATSFMRNFSLAD